MGKIKLATINKALGETRKLFIRHPDFEDEVFEISYDRNKLTGQKELQLRSMQDQSLAIGYLAETAVGIITDWNVVMDEVSIDKNGIETVIEVPAPISEEFMYQLGLMVLQKIVSTIFSDLNPNQSTSEPTNDTFVEVP